ncbi:type III-B CRISPR-associated protein Cas10/Cmr2 [Acidiferrobacter sp. SPIII_3]|jgi:CRISPR-associated protein Cmr2|uniref:type III-B CRISPR-associated protein Cas10/Cmr2 n=1 Tax=Acidiferrobacter sp. SPIII_3 TaxID=1281578 RepID=UPI00143D1DFA|nr:type III-B CRISPR-associated protein Cas10/Cmr2 [Acidiferrobacter sp. SPIII_3]
MSDDMIWKTKLAARIHDPAEKALVLLRDPEGHEGGTSHALKRLLGLDQPPEHIDPDNEEVLSRVIFKKGLPLSIYRHVQRADWWAAAADRPQWPMQEITVTTASGNRKTLKVADWAQVRWAKDPVLIHPLTGEQYKLPGGLSETDIHDIKERSFAHFSQILATLGAQAEAPQDLRKALLAFWRFGPDLAEDEDFGKLGELWKLLPADTRIPDHSIWDHLDLTSAFAGAFAADAEGEIALLAVSIGPVQPFIAAARKMDDLWAGSHLLSRLAWEAMRPVCESLGPDAVLFPRLRGIPQVDLWLRDQMDLPDKLFERCEWLQSATDANPLFSAALPNRFVAVVPASQSRQIAQQVTGAVREWLRDTGDDVVSRLLDVAGLDGETATPYEQMKNQLEGFPEVHWAAVPFSLIRARNIEKQTDLDVATLSEAMAPFFGGGQGKPHGFLDTPAWQVLQKDIAWGDNTTFFAPNPGVLYPAVYDLAERVMAAAKAARPFGQTSQKGWRCSLTGEGEWLTTDLAQLAIPPGSRKDTLWTRVSTHKPAWARKGEHLGALAAIKRLWPTIFAEEVREALRAGEGGNRSPGGRFVVSTHTMALAHQLDRWVENGGLITGDLNTDEAESVALPRRLMRHKNKVAIERAKRIPGLLEAARERDSEDNEAYEGVTRQVRQALARGSADKKEIKLEAYYALIMMDGDRMGAILSGDENNTIRFCESLHPKVQKGFDEHAARQELIRRYGTQKRPISPNRHLAISGALNDFSQTVVRHVVEEEHLGRVIYAGGDDVLAMLPVADMLSAMQRLRHAYSGIDPDHEGGVWHGLTLQNGFAAIKAGHGDRERLQLMRMMGRNATASCGAVIAHHQAPLSAVMRELRAAEKRAKNEGGRDAFSITVIKRSGGALRLTEKWGEPIALLNALIAFLRTEGVSRRAVYNTLEWLHDLPDPNESPGMLESLIAYQFDRQIQARENQKVRKTHDVPTLAARMAALTTRQPKDRLKWLENFLTVAEFLARETRSGNGHEAARGREDAA